MTPGGFFLGAGLFRSSHPAFPSSGGQWRITAIASVGLPT
jgi:hypothetical protein